MFDEPPVPKRPACVVTTIVEPNAKLSGSTSVACWLVKFLYGSVLIVVSATFAAAVRDATSATRPAAASASRKRATADTLTERFSTGHPGKPTAMLAFLLLLLIVVLFVGLGFVVKWLFVIALIAALLWLIGFFTRGARARWYRW